MEREIIEKFTWKSKTRYCHLADPFEHRWSIWICSSRWNMWSSKKLFSEQVHIYFIEESYSWLRVSKAAYPIIFNFLTEMRDFQVHLLLPMSLVTYLECLMMVIWDTEIIVMKKLLKEALWHQWLEQHSGIIRIHLH